MNLFMFAALLQKSLCLNWAKKLVTEQVKLPASVILRIAVTKYLFMDVGWICSQVKKSNIKYLRVGVPKDPKQIYKLNYLNMIEKFKSNIEAWRLLPLFMLGRVNAIRMVALPRFLYLFQNLPIFIPKAFFKSLDSVFFFLLSRKLTVTKHCDCS